MRLFGYGLDVKCGERMKQGEGLACETKGGAVIYPARSRGSCHWKATRKACFRPRICLFYINIAFSTYKWRYKVGYWLYGSNDWTWFIMLNVYAKIMLIFIG